MKVCVCSLLSPCFLLLQRRGPSPLLVNCFLQLRETVVNMLRYNTSLAYLLTVLALVLAASGASDSAEINHISRRADATSNASSNDQVAFLQTLQTASVASMSCLITLVNMTVNPIGTCLGLTTLAELVVQPPQNGSFSDSLGNYLSTVCASTECTAEQLSDAKIQLSDTCDSSSNTQLVRVVQSIVDNYTNSYRTLACSVYL